jgi:hypothetical protein
MEIIVGGWARCFLLSGHGHSETCTSMKNDTMVDSGTYTWMVSALRGTKTSWQVTFYFFIRFCFLMIL